MQPVPDFPTVEEWLAMMRADPELAKRHLKHLSLQRTMHGLNAPAHLIFSIEEYALAEERLAHAPMPDPAVPPSDPPTADRYPDEQRWRELLEIEPEQARKHYTALQVQVARYGLMNTPFALQESIDAYRRVAAEQQPAPPETSQPAPPQAPRRPWWKRLLGLY
jgi:hypothetical protein